MAAISALDRANRPRLAVPISLVYQRADFTDCAVERMSQLSIRITVHPSSIFKGRETKESPAQSPGTEILVGQYASQAGQLQGGSANGSEQLPRR